MKRLFFARPVVLFFAAIILTAQPAGDAPIVLNGTLGRIVVAPGRVYLQSTDGPGVYAILTIAVSGERRGILTVVNPATAKSIMLDPDQGILMNGKVIMPMVE
jgi:hypothetical protein